MPSLAARATLLWKIPASLQVELLDTFDSLEEREKATLMMAYGRYLEIIYPDVDDINALLMDEKSIDENLPNFKRITEALTEE